MKVFNLSLYILLWLLNCVALPKVAAQVNNKQPEQVTFLQEVDICRSLQQQLEEQEPRFQPHDPEGERLQAQRRQAIAIKLLQKLKTHSIKPNSLGANFFRYY